MRYAPTGAASPERRLPGSTSVYCELDGETHGPVALFDDDGRLTHLATEIRGEYDGVAIDFYANGKKQKETHYVAGKMQGPVIGWHPDGSKAYEGTNVDDEAEGTFRAFDASGREVGRYEMTRGNGREVHWHPNRVKASKVEMVGGLEQGLATTWHPNGAKASEAHYDKGRKNGAYAEWDARGHHTTGTYADEREVGEWTHRDAKGAIVQVDRWADGDLVSSIAYQDGGPLAKRRKDAACRSEAGLAKAYARETRGDVAGAGHCVQRPVHFPGVVVIGVFAHDLGCAAYGAMVDCRWQATPDGTAILKRAGWRRANEAAREQLALAYVAEIAETFGGDEPSLERTADGTYVVRIGVSAGPA